MNDAAAAVSTDYEVRTSLSLACPPEKALKLLKEGNLRYTDASGQQVRKGGPEQRKAFVENGQKPMAVVFGCADSRAPIDTIFDTQPGDLFILRNAGNTCTRAEGSIVGSMEYAIRHLDSKLILVLGHTKCGALAGATKTMLAQKDSPNACLCKGQSALEILLGGLVPVAKKAADELPGASEEQIAARAIGMNVFHTIARLFHYSPVLRKMVASGEVQVHGGIYDLESGEVEFMGQHPAQDGLVETHLEVVDTHQPTADEKNVVIESSF